MNSFWKSWPAKTAALLLVVLTGLLAGCGALAESHTNSPAGPGKTSDALNVGELITVVFTDTPTTTPAFEERVKDDGTITLAFNQTFQVVGKTRRDLEKEIRARYVPDYYRNLTVTVKPLERYFYVGGEVKNPSRQPHPGEITVLKAIASAGGFTDYANKNKVRVTRADGKTVIVNCEKALEDATLDLPVYAGDKINVPRSLL